MYNKFVEHEHFEALYPVTARAWEIEKILSFIKEGGSCQLIGLPGVGRSTVMGLLSYNKKLRVKHLGPDQDKTHFVMVNFSEIRKRPLFDAMKFIFLCIEESLRDRRMTDEHLVVSKLFKEALGFSDELVLFQGLKHALTYLAFERKLHVILLLDRFEEYVPVVTSEFFTNLRTLRALAKYKFSVVFSLNRALEDVLDPALLADYYEFIAGHTVATRLFDEVSTDFRLSYIEKVTGKKLRPEAIKEILALTGGHGKSAKLSVEAVLAHGEVKDLAQFLLDQASVRGALSEIWQSLSPFEQAVLRAKDYASEDASYLSSVYLVEGGQLRMPLFAEYILKLSTASEGGGGKIVYEEHTNTIKRDGMTLSDHLTSSEFRLLRYLVQNPERVVEREELISAVWGDMKSTAGITDQAVDQLIFRLRRKIEDDPNNPRHLHTVKGRGFKFDA